MRIEVVVAIVCTVRLGDVQRDKDHNAIKGTMRAKGRMNSALSLFGCCEEGIRLSRA